MDKLQSFLNDLIMLLTTFDFFKYFEIVKQYFVDLGFERIQEILTSSATAFALIVAAEIGDKSQLVCMALASKHRPVPVLLGAVSAFALLNSLAVGFGAAVAKWLPGYVIAIAVAVLFVIYGIQALRTEADESEEVVKEKTGHGIFFTTFLLIVVAEFGDKTQLAVVGLSSTNNAIGVWLGATLALGLTSTLGVLAGRKLVQKFPLELLHKISGVLFLLLACVATAKAYKEYFHLD